MHGEINIKYVNAQQAIFIYKYRNIKEKLQKTMASIWYNKICRVELQPKYMMTVFKRTETYVGVKL
jgi:hypothetical protein